MKLRGVIFWIWRIKEVLEPFLVMFSIPNEIKVLIDNIKTRSSKKPVAQECVYPSILEHGETLFFVIPPEYNTPKFSHYVTLLPPTGECFPNGQKVLYLSPPYSPTINEVLRWGIETPLDWPLGEYRAIINICRKNPPSHFIIDALPGIFILSPRI
jgi:hypothetical protein